MFEISGVLEAKYLQSGEILRNKKAFRYYLNSKDGVVE